MVEVVRESSPVVVGGPRFRTSGSAAPPAAADALPASDVAITQQPQVMPVMVPRGAEEGSRLIVTTPDGQDVSCVVPAAGNRNECGERSAAGRTFLVTFIPLPPPPTDLGSEYDLESIQRALPVSPALIKNPDKSRSRRKKKHVRSALALWTGLRAQRHQVLCTS